MASKTNEQHPQVHLLGGENNRDSVLPIYTMTGSPEFLYAAMNLSARLAELVGANYQTAPAFITGVTRGGVPVLAGMESVWPAAPADVVWGGSWADKAKDRLPQIPQPSPMEEALLVIGDTVVATGNTLVATLQELTRLSQDGFTQIAVIAPVVTKLGIETILAAFPEARIFTAYIEPETEWVTFAGQNGQPDKRVLFVGTGFGDAGDMTVEAMLQILQTDPRAFDSSVILSMIAQLVSEERAVATSERVIEDQPATV